MTIRINRWSLDTCDCVVDFSWDDTVPEASRVHNIANVVQRCSAHSALATNNDIWNVVQEENPRRNKALQNILDNVPAAFYDLEPDGVTRRFKRGIKIDFSWSGTVPNRVLTLTVTGATLTTNQKNNVQTFLNNRFGAGRVLLVNG